MPFGEETQKLLAIKLPYSHHLLEDIEHECETIATRYDGWGGFKLASQGLECGKLLVKIVESTLCRRRDRGKEAHKAH